MCAPPVLNVYKQKNPLQGDGLSLIILLVLQLLVH